MKTLNVIFFGTNNFSVEILKTLHENIDLDINVKCVCTKIAKPFGPKQILKDSEVFEYTKNNNLLVKTYRTLRKIEIQNELSNFNADIGIVASYGLILPQEVLDIFPLGCINVHASLLPKYRGSAPIQRAIMNGEKETGITIMQMDSGIDTGDMLLKSKINIENKNFGEVFIELSKLGGKLLLEYLKNRENINPIKQNDENSSYANKIENEDCIIDFKTETSKQIYQKILALSPLPKAFFYDKTGKKIFVLSAEIYKDNFDISTFDTKKDIYIKCLDEKYIKLLTLQKEGKKILNSRDFLNGSKISL